MARRRHSNRRRRGSFSFLYKLLSTLVICACLITAMTLFFRVDTIVVVGAERYSDQEIIDATGIRSGDNLLLFNKNSVARIIASALPYIETTHFEKKLPDTLLIEVTECGRPLALVQDGYAWLISPKGKIVDQLSAAEAEDYGVISGCQLLAPTVGTTIALATEYAAQQSSLLSLLAALESEGMLDQVDAIRLDDLSILSMDYAGRFTVQMTYGADYVYKLRFLAATLEKEEIQDNMTGTFDMRGDDGRVNFIQNVR